MCDDVSSHSHASMSVSCQERRFSLLYYSQFSRIFFNFTIVVIVWNLQQKPKNIVF